MSYIGTQPNNVKKNIGIYNPNEILQLTKDGNWGGSMELIESQTASTSSALNFTNLGNYDVHFMTLDNFQNTTSTTRQVNARFSNDGGSSYESTSNYDRVYVFVSTGGSSGDIRNTGQTEMSRFFEIDTDSRTSQSVIYFYNLLDSSKFSFVTFQSWNSEGDYTEFGGFSYEVAETINAISIYACADAFVTGNAKLYGLKEI